MITNFGLSEDRWQRLVTFGTKPMFFEGVYLSNRVERHKLDEGGVECQRPETISAEIFSC